MTSGNVKVAPGALVCKEQEFVGDITIGAKTIIHPKVKIIAEAGPIIIGESNLIEERAEIINRHPKTADGSKPNETVMIIGNNNVFEVDSHSEALKIGDNNVLEAKSCVGRETVLTNGCVIGAMCEVSTRENLPENTVIYGSQCQRRVQSEKPQPQTLQLDFLAKILPSYHYIKKPVKSAPLPTK